jgi:sulfite reductase (ferredoxin)
MAATVTPVPRRRGEGQWALGHLEPLNPNERTKKDDDGLNVRARIENVYSRRGFASIDPRPPEAEAAVDDDRIGTP